MMPVEWTAVESSNISAVKFTKNKMDDLGVLAVEFRSGHTYEYFDVPSFMAETLVYHSEPGVYFRDQIRGSYDLEQVR